MPQIAHMTDNAWEYISRKAKLQRATYSLRAMESVVEKRVCEKGTLFKRHFSASGTHRLYRAGLDTQNFAK
jgi:hypothetical protein